MANILVVDDEAEVRYAIRAVLEDGGHQVSEADTGTAGLAAIEEAKTPYDLVICDIIMPDKEGIETIVEIKQRLPEQKIVPISGGGRIKKEDYLAVAAAVGATYTVSKPFDADTLTDMVNTILKS